MLRRRLLPTFVLALAALGLGAKKGTPPEVQFVRVWPQWREAYEFQRISEYFTRVENDGDWIVRRTQPVNRSGYYFLARVRHRAVSLMGAKFVLHIIVPSSPDPKDYIFPANVDPGEHVFQLGITGSDWPNKGTHPVAWRLDLRAPDGHLLAWQQSFMWEKPGAQTP